MKTKINSGNKLFHLTLTWYNSLLVEMVTFGLLVLTVLSSSEKEFLNLTTTEQVGNPNKKMLPLIVMPVLLTKYKSVLTDMSGSEVLITTFTTE